MPTFDFPTWFLSALLAPFGLVLGSFANVLIHRLPQEDEAERDVVKLLGRSGPSCLEKTMEEVMTRSIYHVSLKTSVDECMGLMSGKGIRHVPVTDGKMVVGVVSIRDVVGEVVHDREITIKGLENYIVGADFQN